MRKFMISLAAAGTALAFASPASAQYYPQQQPYGYQGQGQGYGYGQNNYGQVRALQARIDRVQYQLRFAGRNRVSERSTEGLRKEARHLERKLRSAASYGLNPYEANDIERRVARLEQRVQYAMGHRYGRYGNTGYNNGYGNNAYGYADRDRDGRDDRYEDDHGNDRDDD